MGGPLHGATQDAERLAPLRNGNSYCERLAVATVKATQPPGVAGRLPAVGVWDAGGAGRLRKGGT